MMENEGKIQVPRLPSSNNNIYLETTNSTTAVAKPAPTAEGGRLLLLDQAGMLLLEPAGMLLLDQAGMVLLLF